MTRSILLAALLATLSTPVFAEHNFVHLQYTFRDTVASDSQDTNRQGVNFTVGRKLSDNVTVDLGEQFRTEKLNNNDGVSTTRLESGVTYTYGLTNGVSLYTRGGLGYKFTTNSDYSYYSIEPGAKLDLANGFVVKAGYRFRDSFNNSYNEQTDTVRLGADYTLAKNQTLTLGVDRSYGASEFIGYNLGYLVKF
jgi:hypothetical protein